MKKKNTSISEEIKFITLFRDDLEEVYKILRSLTEEVTIEVNDYLLSGIEEIGELPKEKFDHMDFSTKNPSLSFSIRNVWVWVHCSSPTPEAELVTMKLLQFLHGKVNKTSVFIDKLDPSPSLLLLIPAVASFYYFKDNQIIITISLTVILLIGAFVVFKLLFTILTKNVRIYFQYKKERPSFFFRNKDTIILSIFFLILGIILTKGFDLLVK